MPRDTRSRIVCFFVRGVLMSKREEAPLLMNNANNQEPLYSIAYPKRTTNKREIPTRHHQQQQNLKFDLTIIMMFRLSATAIPLTGRQRREGRNFFSSHFRRQISHLLLVGSLFVATTKTTITADAFMIKSTGTGGWATGFDFSADDQSYVISGTLYDDNFWDDLTFVGNGSNEDRFQCFIVQIAHDPTTNAATVTKTSSNSFVYLLKVLVNLF